MANVIRDKEMSVSIDALYKAITSFDAYPSFLPEVVSAKVESGATKEKARVRFELEVVKRFQYTLEFTMKSNSEVHWKLVESDFFKVNQGVWKLESMGESKTKVHYELEVGFGFLVPGFVSKKLTEVSLPKMFESFENQAKKG